MKGEVHTGGCLCGVVRYSVHGDPPHVGRCHCADCRKESGGAFTVYAQLLVEVFEMTGEIASYDGRGFSRQAEELDAWAGWVGETTGEMKRVIQR